MLKKLTKKEIEGHIKFLQDKIGVSNGGVQCWLDNYRYEYRGLHGRLPSNSELLEYMQPNNSLKLSNSGCDAMTLDEAIEHCNDNAIKELSCGNFECSKEHIQLRDWLIELKKIKEREAKK